MLVVVVLLWVLMEDPGMATATSQAGDDGGLKTALWRRVWTERRKWKCGEG